MRANPETVKAWKQANRERVSEHNKAHYLKYRLIINERRRKKKVLYLEPV